MKRNISYVFSLQFPTFVLKVFGLVSFVAFIENKKILSSLLKMELKQKFWVWLLHFNIIWRYACWSISFYHIFKYWNNAFYHLTLARVHQTKKVDRALLLGFFHFSIGLGLQKKKIVSFQIPWVMKTMKRNTTKKLSRALYIKLELI